MAERRGSSLRLPVAVKMVQLHLVKLIVVNCLFPEASTNTHKFKENLYQSCICQFRLNDITNSSLDKFLSEINISKKIGYAKLNKALFLTNRFFNLR